MFQRNALAELKKWAERKDRKPLVLRGARQVGKTTLVEEFAKSYEISLGLNLDKPDHAALFDGDMGIEELVMAIYLMNNKPRKDVPTLLFIDEIQNSPKAVAQLRYFYEEMPHIHLIAAGSLLESLMDVNISFPVGRVEYMAVRPCSFNEFLGAISQTELQKAQAGVVIPSVLHDKVSSLFKTYTLIGGMPEIVKNYAENRDIVSLQRVYETLITGYRDDVEKYAQRDSAKNVIRYILTVGWASASERITFEKFGNSNYRSREMSEAFRTLEKTMLLELCYPTTSCILPLNGQTKYSPKLLWLDTGLVNYVAGIQKEFIGITDLNDAWRGRVAEHIVGQELLACDNIFSHKRYFWVGGSKSEAEVDYVIQYQDRVIPIEVKSGGNSKLRSLHQFMDKSPGNIAVRFWGKPYSVDDVATASGKKFRLINVPYYYADRLKEILTKL